MKKLILFFSIVGIGVFLTSCLGKGNNNLSGQGQLFYINQVEGIQVAYNGGFAMTSNQIKTKEPDRWYLITWSWQTENGMAATNIHNATTSQIEDIPLGSFISDAAPEQISAPIQGLSMVRDMPVMESFGDYLIFPYKWNKKEGETVVLKLYSKANKIDASGLLTLDVRLEKSGTSTATSEKSTDGLAAVKMSWLRSLIKFEQRDYQDIQLKLDYYKSATEKASTIPYPIRIYKKK